MQWQIYFYLSPFSFGCVCLPDVKCHVFCLSITKDYLGIMRWLVWSTGQFGFKHVVTKYLVAEFTISLLKDADSHQKLEELT